MFSLRFKRGDVYSAINGNTRISFTVWPRLGCTEGSEMEVYGTSGRDNSPVINAIFIRIFCGMTRRGNISCRCVEGTSYSRQLCAKCSSCKRKVFYLAGICAIPHLKIQTSTL